MENHVLAHALGQSPGLDAHFALTGDGLTCKHCDRYATQQVSNARLHLAARHEEAYTQVQEAEKAAEATRLALAEKQAAEALLTATPPADPTKKAAVKRQKIHPFDRS